LKHFILGVIQQTYKPFPIAKTMRQTQIPSGRLVAADKSSSSTGYIYPSYQNKKDRIHSILNKSLN